MENSCSKVYDTINLLHYYVKGSIKSHLSIIKSKIQMLKAKVVVKLPLIVYKPLAGAIFKIVPQPKRLKKNKNSGKQKSKPMSFCK